MKLFLLAFAVFSAVDAANYEDLSNAEWALYKAEFGKTYATPGEDSFRMGVFHENKLKIAEHNLRYLSGEVNYELGVNQFTDMLSEEVDNLYNGYNKQNRMRALPGEDPYLPESEGEPFVSTYGKVPKKVDWVKKGFVTPVRDQKSCGSCYAFAALAALESRLMLKHNKSVVLSPQDVVDCSWEYGNHGCNGGLVQKVYEFVKGEGGVNDERTYPYDGAEGKCRRKLDKVAAKIRRYVKVNPGSEDDLKKALAHGPVTVSVDASSPSFKSYKKGVYRDENCSSVRLNHAVLAVGYGTDAKTKEDYWIIKNSWDKTWGENGYGRIARNAGNMCGIATRPLFPIV